MTIAEIISAARAYSQTTGATWFTPADELRSVNRAYRDIYEKILDSNDEFFIKEITVPASTLTMVREYTYSYALPADWHRLRKLVSIIPDGEHIFDRLDPLDNRRAEGYRYFQDTMRLTFRDDYAEFRIEYYPNPQEFTDTADTIVYPNQLEPLIIAYQVAMDIIKQQNGDATPMAEEYLRLWNRFATAASKRDNSHYPRVANRYRSTTWGW